MVVSIFGYLCFYVGIFVLALPLILVELSRPRDWLIGGLFLFLGVFLFVENDLLSDSINLLLISMAILYGKMILEISQNRWSKLSSQEKKRIGSFQRWFESFKQIGQSFALFGNSLFNFFTRFRIQSQKSAKDKKWVRPELKEEDKNIVIDQNASTDSEKIGNQELTENEETS
tara:strand:- start:1486 stop:2004 length:519 start_codon:yes stop_codon:yes gene_type:complete